MRRFLQAAVAAAFTYVPLTAAASQTDCQTKALRELQRLSPQGYAIYGSLADKKQFLRWVSCDDLQLSLSTAVHESVHMLTEEKDGFPLIDGGVIRRPREVSRFFAPKQIARQFDQNDMFVKTYLRRGAASSADEFVYLLDELNAYSHDLNSAVRLVSIPTGGGQAAHRDGLTSLMSFVMSYVTTARQENPTTWQGLQRSETKEVVRTLWTQAEAALATSCGLPAFGLNDRRNVGFLCNRRNGEALGELLGRAPACASACLPAGTASLH